MAQTSRISRNNTEIKSVEGGRVVTLHYTDIVKVNDDGTVVLNSGGWKTSTTKTRINQVATEWDLGFSVYQQNYVWYVDIGGKPRRFLDGMVFIPCTAMGAPLMIIGGIAFDW